jgi:heat shock protein HtpX
MNVVKLFFLMALPTAIVVVSKRVLSEEVFFFVLLGWFILAVGFYWFSDNVVLKMCRAELLTVYHSPTIFRTVEAMCSQAALPMPKLYMIPEEAPNICSVGRNRRSAGLVFTEGIVKSLSADELRCAISHELVHIYHYDTPISVFAALFASFLGMGTTAARSRASALESHNTNNRKGKRFAFGGILSLFAPIATMIIQSLVDLNRDFRADELGAKLTGDPLAMANAIRTMEKRKHVTPMSVVPAVAHLFMVTPIRPGRIERMFASHPSMVERIERLNRQKVMRYATPQIAQSSSVK